MEEGEALIPRHGGYRNLKTFQLTELVCGVTAQAKAFEREGGFTERLYRVRTAARKHPE